jgi:hypothetical protein
MTVALVLPDRIVTDSRLVWGFNHTIGKIFRRPDGALFVTAGTSRHTYAFEKAMNRGQEPEPIEELEDEAFEGAVLQVDGRIVLYDEHFAPSLIGESWASIGSGSDVARSWFKHGHEPELCIERVFEVRDDCGPPVVTVMLNQPKRSRRS